MGGKHLFSVVITDRESYTLFDTAKEKLNSDTCILIIIVMASDLVPAEYSRAKLTS